MLLLIKPHTNLDGDVSVVSAFYTQMQTSRTLDPSAAACVASASAGQSFGMGADRSQGGDVSRTGYRICTMGTHRTGATLFTAAIVHKGFPWIKCYRLQTQRSQRTHSCCSMSTMGDEAVCTPFHTPLNKATPDLVLWLLVWRTIAGCEGVEGDGGHLDEND